MVFAGKNIKDLYQETVRKLDSGDDSVLQPTHAVVSLYKAVISDMTVKAIEVFRKSCGGHGYMQASGIPIVLNMAIPACTYDGDNHILMLQTSKFLNKILDKRAKAEGVFEVVSTEPPSLSRFREASPEFYGACFRNIAYHSAHRLHERFAELKSKSVTEAQIWNYHL